MNELSTLSINACAKSCVLDPLPGSVMKASINTLLPAIVRIVNLSFAEACVPDILKQSAMETRIKKPLLDNEQLSNYRPISNLRFMAEAAEKIASDRLKRDLVNNDLEEPCSQLTGQVIAQKLHY